MPRGQGQLSRVFPALTASADGLWGGLAFGQVPAKLKEHYGIEVPVSAVRTITEAQATRIHAQEQRQTTLPAQGVAWIIAETDGSMIPIVDTAPPQTGWNWGDRRKTRQVRWQEARLSLAHAHSSGTPRFAATVGAPEVVGEQLRTVPVGWDWASQAGCIASGMVRRGLRIRCTRGLGNKGRI